MAWQTSSHTRNSSEQRTRASRRRAWLSIVENRWSAAVVVAFVQVDGFCVVILKIHVIRLPVKLLKDGSSKTTVDYCPHESQAADNGDEHDGQQNDRAAQPMRIAR